MSDISESPPLLPVGFQPVVTVLGDSGDGSTEMNLNGCTSLRYWVRKRIPGPTTESRDGTDDFVLITDHSNDKLVSFNLTTGKPETVLGSTTAHSSGKRLMSSDCCDDWQDTSNFLLRSPSGVDVWPGADPNGTDNPFMKLAPTSAGTDPATSSGALVIEYFTGAMLHVRNGTVRTIPRVSAAEHSQFYDVKVTRDGRYGYVTAYDRGVVERVDILNRTYQTVVGTSGVASVPAQPLVLVDGESSSSPSGGRGLNGRLWYEPKSVTLVRPMGLCWIEPTARHPTPESILCITSAQRVVWYHLPMLPRAVLASWTDAGITRDLLIPELWVVISAYAAGMEAAEIIPYDGRMLSPTDTNKHFDSPTGVGSTSGGFLLFADSRGDVLGAVDPFDGRTQVVAQLTADAATADSHSESNGHSVCVSESRRCCYVSDLGHSRICCVTLPPTFFAPSTPSRAGASK